MVPAEGVLLAGIVVPVFPCWAETAPVGALSFCCPEVGALTVTTSFLLGAGAVEGVAGGPAATETGAVTVCFTASFVTVCFPVVPAGNGATATLPDLTAESVVFVIEPFVPCETGVLPPFGVGAETTDAGLFPVPVTEVLAPLLWGVIVEVFVSVFVSLETMAVSVVWRAVLAGGGARRLPVAVDGSASPF